MEDDELTWACENCPLIKAQDLHPYTIKLIKANNLQLSGYPLAADDLTLEEWVDLGRLKQCLQTQPQSKSKSASTEKPASPRSAR